VTRRIFSLATFFGPAPTPAAGGIETFALGLRFAPRERCRNRGSYDGAFLGIAVDDREFFVSQIFPHNDWNPALGKRRVEIHNNRTVTWGAWPGCRGLVEQNKKNASRLGYYPMRVTRTMKYQCHYAEERGAVPFQDARDAEKRLVNPQPLSEEEIFDLIPWLQLVGEGSRARLQAHLGIANVRAIRGLNETSATIEGAVRRMDEGSTKLGTEGLRLNKALFVWTIVGIAVSTIIGVVAVWIAVKSYKDASASANQQQQALIQQQQTLDGARRSLESAGQALNRLTTLSEQQLKQAEEYQKQALAKPDFAVDFLFLQPTPKTVRKYPLQSIFEYEVPYGRDFVFLAVVKNVTHTPAHNLRVQFGIGTSDKIESISVVPPQVVTEVPAPADMPGWKLFQKDAAVFYPGEWHLQVIARIKADAPDGLTQMFVGVDGGDLTHRYQQWAVLHKLSP